MRTDQVACLQQLVDALQREETGLSHDDQVRCRRQRVERQYPQARGAID
jgi:hypothetical protein